MGNPAMDQPWRSHPAHVLACGVTTLANAQGQEQTRTSILYMDGGVVVTLKDRIVLPNGTAPAIQAICTSTDPMQPGIVDHHEISL